MFVVENNNGKKTAKKLEQCSTIKKSSMVLDCNGKKIIKDIDPKTYKLKFG